MSASPASITSASAARRHVQSLVREHWNSPSAEVPQEAVIDLLLVVSELVTNAIRHGEGLAGFHATVTEEGVRLHVRDNSDVVPADAYGSGEIPPGHPARGYGWPLIIRLSREITIEPSPEGGKTISVLVPLT
ncbi:ATP-binding protein [Streptomyces sp. NPDC058475]|uniref:ATP-binding protein n=1 Tax=Streptomyces sp. NPDC058475 TaxID=3346518 RepID=UPI00365C1E8A